MEEEREPSLNRLCVHSEVIPSFLLLLNYIILSSLLSYNTIESYLNVLILKYDIKEERKNLEEINKMETKTEIEKIKNSVLYNDVNKILCKVGYKLENFTISMENDALYLRNYMLGSIAIKELMISGFSVFFSCMNHISIYKGVTK